MRTRILTYSALAVLVAASIAWSFAFDWREYQNANPTAITEVPRDKQSTIDGAAFSLADLRVIEGDSDDGRRYQLAEGTDLVVVDLRVTPREQREPEEIGGCDIGFKAPSPDGEREWRPAFSGASTYPDQVDEDAPVFGCTTVADDDTPAGEPYVWRQFFVVPAGGAADGYLEVRILTELPLALHLR